MTIRVHAILARDFRHRPHVLDARIVLHDGTGVHDVTAITGDAVDDLLAARADLIGRAKRQHEVGHSPAETELVSERLVSFEDVALIDFRPGHMKWDFAYSIQGMQPDVVAQLWDGYENPANLQYLTNYTRVDINGYPFFLRNDSQAVRWDMVEKLKQQALK